MEFTVERSLTRQVNYYQDEDSVIGSMAVKRKKGVTV